MSKYIKIRQNDGSSNVNFSYFLKFLKSRVLHKIYIFLNFQVFAKTV